MGALHSRLRRRKLTVAAAESCTGGLLAAVLTAHAGSSEYFKGGAVVYSNEAKTIFADVPPDLIHGHGAVSSVVAGALARGARGRLGAKIGLGITGLAGKAFRATGVEKLLAGTAGSAADVQKAAAVVAEGVDANTDLHASAAYRRQMAKVYTSRALTQALARTS